MSFIVNRPKKKPGFCLIHSEDEGRNVKYTIESYATQNPEGDRY
jgi:ribulose-bisphosphate carboxylase small chain